MSQISLEQLFAQTLLSNANILAHLEVVLENHAEILANQTGQDKKGLHDLFKLQINERMMELKQESLRALTKVEQV